MGLSVCPLGYDHDDMPFVYCPCDWLPELEFPDLAQYEGIAKALSRWSSGNKPWETRHPKNRRHWLLVAEALCANDPAITESVLERVRARKAQLDV